MTGSGDNAKLHCGIGPREIGAPFHQEFVHQEFVHQEFGQTARWPQPNNPIGEAI
jgi:hypothetical protein